MKGLMNGVGAMRLLVPLIGGISCHHRRAMMIRLQTLFFLALGCALAGPATADPIIQNPARQALEIKWYASIEENVKEQYEVQRSKWQGEISSKGAHWTDAHERRLRMIAYNRAAFLAGCTAKILETNGPLGVKTLLPACMKPFLDEMDKYFEKAKLLTESNKVDFENCAKDAVDTVREGYLRPYGFLSVPASGPHLYDFEKLNTCLEASL
jgi:hypothetical protein